MIAVRGEAAIPRGSEPARMPLIFTAKHARKRGSASLYSPGRRFLQAHAKRYTAASGKFEVEE